MPEIGEIARTVHFLRKHLTNRRIAKVLTTEDSIVFNAKADGTTHTSFAAALTGKTVLDARQQGKYFWLVMDSPPHPLFHFGMTGWIKFKGIDTFYKSEERNDAADDEDAPEEKDRTSKTSEEWPPRFMKFVLQMEGEPACEAAFVDKRRLARIRLVDAAADDMRHTTPLKENGPDPVIDKDVLTADWLVKKLKSKKVPVKAFLLDQAVISGVGNWVGDEVLYHAKIHPEQYSNTLTDAQMAQLHESLGYVCGLACETLSDSSKFPKEWLFKHRWGKGKKGEGANVLPNGEKIVHLKVGGRTSAVVLNVQKKTGPVAGDVEGEDAEEGGEHDEKGLKKKKAEKAAKESKKPVRKETKKSPKKRKRSTKDEMDEEDDEDNDEDEEDAEDEEEAEEEKPARKPKTASKTKTKTKPPPSTKGKNSTPSATKKTTPAIKNGTAKSTTSKKMKTDEAPPTTGRRKSARLGAA